MDDDQWDNVGQLAHGFYIMLQQYSRLAKRYLALRKELEVTVRKLEKSRVHGVAGNQSTPQNTTKDDSSDPSDTKSLSDDTMTSGYLEDLDVFFKKGAFWSVPAYQDIRRADVAQQPLLTELHRRQQLKAAQFYSNVFDHPMSSSGRKEKSPSPSTSAKRRRESGCLEDSAETALSGKLGCPFTSHSSTEKPVGTKRQHDLPTPDSSRDNARAEGPGQPYSNRPSFHDPLAQKRLKGEDLGGREDDAVSNAASAPNSAASGPACPIRFLDQHKPEEIAQYFENHKHELPRSHEICVKRFQDNSASIRELDAKYGNLVAMIQGLGMKHKPMLPENPNEGEMREVEEAQRGDERSKQRIENWAKTVSESHVAAAGSGYASMSQMPKGESVEGCRDAALSSAHGQADNAAIQPPEQNLGLHSDATNDQERVSRFARPLKDVRLGESPSRPWGVPIPATYMAQSTTEKSQDPTLEKLAPVNTPSMYRNAESTADGMKDTSSPPSRCPFHNVKAAGRNDDLPRRDQVVAEPTINTNHPSMGSDHAQDHEPQDGRHKSSGFCANRFINYGTAVIANGSQLLPSRASAANGTPIDDHEFTNHGTMIIGYDLADDGIQRLLKSLGSKK